MIRTIVVRQPSLPYLLVVPLLVVLRLAVVGVMRHWRETSALRLAPAVYEAGGDPAEVLRALAVEPGPSNRLRRANALDERRVHQRAEKDPEAS